MITSPVCQAQAGDIKHLASRFNQLLFLRVLESWDIGFHKLLLILPHTTSFHSLKTLYIDSIQLIRQDTGESKVFVERLAAMVPNVEEIMIWNGGNSNVHVRAVPLASIAKTSVYNSFTKTRLRLDGAGLPSRTFDALEALFPATGTGDSLSGSSGWRRRQRTTAGACQDRSKRVLLYNSDRRHF
jgi:hypothetical protein